jgi:hypothetical protein
MNETTKSLSIWFFLVGLMGSYIFFLNINFIFGFGIIYTLYSLFQIILTIIFFYISIKLKYLLKNNIVFLVNFFYISIGFSLLSLVYDYISGFGLDIYSIIPVISNFYFLYQIQRLSKDSSSLK